MVYRVGGKEDEMSIGKWSHRSEINKLLDTGGLENGLSEEIYKALLYTNYM
jgi:hypothetical protein